MKKIFSALMMGAFVLALTACGSDKPSATKSVTLSETAVTLTVGATYQINAVTDPANQELTYTSQKPDVATVDADGLVTAVSNGETIILVKSGDAKATLNVTVGEAGPSSKIPEPDAVSGKYLVIFRFNAEVCNDVVFVGTYNDWSSDAANCTVFQPYYGGAAFNDETFTDADGWMYVLIEDASESVCGKPVQLKNDGTFSWDFQCGDAEAWTIHTGAVELKAGYAGECNMEGYSAVTVGELAYWKNQKTPCVEAVKHSYNVTVKLPAIVEGITPAIIGDFNGWATGVALTAEADGSYKYSFEDEEGHCFKFKSGADGEWARQVQGYDAENDTWSDLGNVVLGEETSISLDYSDAAKYRWTPVE